MREVLAIVIVDVSQLREASSRDLDKRYGKQKGQEKTVLVSLCTSKLHLRHELHAVTRGPSVA